MKEGDQVGWKWSGGIATGTVVSVQPDRTEIESKGRHIVRNGTSDDPAVVIRHDNGTPVLKLAHEVQIIKGGSNV